MNGKLFFAVGAIGLSRRGHHKPSTLLAAAKHNRRTIQVELGARSHIDSTKIHLNETIAGPGTPEEVVELALSRMIGAGVVIERQRKDYTQAVELLFSLPPDTTIDIGDYFRRCLKWARDRFGEVNILSADIHRDEAAPHCHILILPLVDGRMRGSSLIARPALVELRKSFSREVSNRFGIKDPPRRLSAAGHGEAVQLVLALLESKRDAILRSGLWQAVKKDIESDPARFVAALGIQFDSEKWITKRPARTMAEIFTSKGKGGQTERRLKSSDFEGQAKVRPATYSSQTDSKTIGFGKEAAVSPGEYQNLSSVGFAQQPMMLTSTECTAVQTPPPKSAEPATSLNTTDSGVGTGAEQRKTCGTFSPCLDIIVSQVRDEDQVACQRNGDIGEFVKSSATQLMSNRLKADAWL